MTVTVVGRWHVPAAEQHLAIAVARHELAARVGQPSARRAAQVFQATEDPSMLLYIGEWADRAAFEQHRGQAGPDTVEAAIRDGGEYMTCERLLFFGNYAYRAIVTGCGIIEAPLEAADIVRGLLMPAGRWVRHGLPGLVHYSILREVTHTRRFVTVHGWQTEAALQHLRGGYHDFREALENVGGSLSHFTGYERASTEPL